MPSEKIPALVLTCDRYHPLTAHMILHYRVLWPSHPLVFHVPYQRQPLQGPDVVPRRTPPGFRDTVLALLEPFSDGDWIYWCIDDKYPIRLLPEVAALARAVAADDLGGLDGLLFCRWRKLLRDDTHLLPEARIGPAGLPLLRRRDYQSIWFHQFLRAGVLRRLFQDFPPDLASAKAMDALKDQAVLPPEQHLYVTETNLATYGESTSRGYLTRNCRDSLRALGLPLPAGFPESEVQMFYGVIR